MYTTLFSQFLEQPITNPNEKYFGYYLPATDIRYLRRHFNKNGSVHNGLIGCFTEKTSYYSAMIVIVKVTLKDINDSEPINHEEFHALLTEDIKYNHVVKDNFQSSVTLKKYFFEYFLLEYADVDCYTEQLRKIELSAQPQSLKYAAKILLNSIGYHLLKTNGLSTGPASIYKCVDIKDIDFTTICNRTGTYNTFTINEGIIAGLYNYLKNDTIKKYSAQTQPAENLFNMFLLGSEHSIEHDKHYKLDVAIPNVNVTYETTTAFGNETYFDTMVWKDVIGSKLSTYVCPSYSKKSIVHKLEWVNDQRHYEYLAKICSIFNLINRPDLCKLETTFEVDYGKNNHLTYTFYISDLLKQKYFTPDENNRIYFGSSITNILPILSPKYFDDIDSICIKNTYHLESESKVNNKIIFNNNQYGIYNPVINGIPNTINNTETQTNVSEIINSKLASVFPNMASTMQTTITPFSYQKRNIILMDNIENKVIAGEHKLCIPTGKLALQNITGNVIKFNLFDTDYYYIGPDYNETDGGDDVYRKEYLYANKNECLDINLTLSGGFICDDVGLGKTYSTISHIVCQRAKDLSREATWDLNNCVIIPSRLLQQWKFEIEKYTNANTLSVVTLGSITDIKKLYKKSADGSLFMPVKYDVYIISCNLLNNKNYNTYIADNYVKTGHDPVYNINKYFDIYRIRWNRLIVDEAHERILSTYNWNHGETSGRDGTTMLKADRMLTRNLVFNISANFRWGLTATPFEHTSNNIIGYICWQAKELKNNLQDPKILADMYEIDNNELKLLCYALESNCLYNKGFYHLPKFITPKNIKVFQQQCFTKTTKRFVSGELNIPIFTEEIKEIELGQIERNIYNNARADNSNVRHTAHIDRIKRLFQLCTNICISDVDIENLGITADSHMTLEELNKAMIKNFEKQLKAAQNELERERADGPAFEKKKLLSNRLKNYIETSIDPGIANEMNSYAGQRIKYFIEACGTSDGYANGTRVTNIDMIVMKNLRRDLYGRLLECSDNLDNLFVLVSEIMGTNPTGVKPNWDDNKVLMITYYLICSFYSKANQNSKDTQENITKLEREVVRLQNQIKLFESNDFIKEKTTEPCIICWAEYVNDSSIAVTDCRHIFCGDCFKAMGTNKSSFPCPECRADVHCKKIKITTMAELKGATKPEEASVDPVAAPVDIDWKAECIAKYGTKMSVLIEYLRGIIGEEGKNNRAIVFSQYDNMLKLIGKTLNEYNISNVYCKGNVHVINKNIDKFKRDPSIRVIMLSSEHSNSGSNLTEASHIIMVDVLNMDKEHTKEVECQAIGRAVRLGQQKPVTVVRLITKNTVESEYYTKNKYDIASIQ